MNSSAMSWISQQGIMENTMFMDQYHDFMDSFDEDLALAFGQDFNNYLPPMNNSTLSSSIDFPANNSINSYYASPEIIIDQAIHQTPDDHFSNFSSPMQSMINPTDQASSAPIIFNFQQVSPIPTINHEESAAVVPEVFRSPAAAGSYNVNNSEEAAPKPVQAAAAKKKSRVRPPSQTYDHIIAERRRREQLSQLFVALSALVPGLKKMDKSSVLEDAIKYLKHLQERVKVLEEKAENKAIESMVIVKKSQIVVEDEGSSDEQSGGFVDEQPLPEIEARVCENHILLRVHCEKEKGVLVKLLCKVESLNMIVVNTNATPFGNVALDITIIAELEKEFNLTVKEVVTALRAVLEPVA